MFEILEKINERPEPFQFYTASDLWTDEHTSKQMLSYHLNETIDVSSRNIEFINRSVEWIAAEFNIGTDSTIVDFGCGPGLYTERLAKCGANVTGIDFSGRSVEYAMDVAVRGQLNIRYVSQNYLEFETEDRFDLVIMIMCDFCALGPEQRRTVLRRFHELLAPGGAVLLDVYSLAAFAGRKELATCEVNLMDGFWSPHRYYGFLNTFKYDEEKVILDKYTIVEEARTRTIYNWLQYFSVESLRSEIENCGLVIDEVLGDVAGAPMNPTAHEFAVVARRPVAP